MTDQEQPVTQHSVTSEAAVNDQVAPPAVQGPIVSLDSVAKQYDSLSIDESPPVLREVNLAVEAGESVAIIGPSGSGKTTLLNIIGALDVPTTGEVLIEGANPVMMNDKERASLRNRRIGFVFQLHHLLPQCTAMENVLVPTLAGEVHAMKEDVEDRARRLLDRAGLGHRLNHRPGQLSGGERQRVALVRALINHPALVLADEPTGSLDRPRASEMADLLLEMNREEGVTLILVTHDEGLATRMRRIAQLVDGRLEE